MQDIWELRTRLANGSYFTTKHETLHELVRQMIEENRVDKQLKSGVVI